MRTLGTVVLVCTLWLIGDSGKGWSAQHPEQASAQERFDLRDLAPKLEHNTSIKLRLPSFLPGVDAQHSIYAIIRSADSSGYDILLVEELPCEGQHNCLYGSVQGSNSPLEPVEGKSLPVRLKGGIKGQFFEPVCYAYCNQAYLRWSEAGAYYSIGIKGEHLGPIVKAANSALPPAAREAN